MLLTNFAFKFQIFIYFQNKNTIIYISNYISANKKVN